MDEIQDYLSSFYSLYNANSSYLRTILSTLNRCSVILRTYIYPPLDRLVRTLAAKPDVASVLLLIVLLFVSLKLLNLLYQTVMFWVRLVFRMVLWSSIIGITTWVFMRGPDGVVDDVQRLADIWRDEYQYWTARQGEGWSSGGKRGFGEGFKAYGRGRAAGLW